MQIPCAQEDVVNHYRIGPDPDHVRKLVMGQYKKTSQFTNLIPLETIVLKRARQKTLNPSL